MTRSRRIGIGHQQLRASVSVFINWFRMCQKEGWLTSVKQRLRLERLKLICGA
jgi:hypothetical protein